LSWLDEFLLGKLIVQILKTYGLDEGNADRQLQLIKILIMMPQWLTQAEENPGAALSSLFRQGESSQFLQVNRYQDIVYFNYESLIYLLAAFAAIGLIQLCSSPGKDKAIDKHKLERWSELTTFLITVAHDNGCRVYPMIEAAEKVL
jgi:hypothetical protein